MTENTMPTLLKLIDFEGYKVVDAKRLELLERVADAAKKWRTGMIDRIEPTPDPLERQRRMHDSRVSTLRLRDAVDELEAMENATSVE